MSTNCVTVLSPDSSLKRVHSTAIATVTGYNRSLLAFATSSDSKRLSPSLLRLSLQIYPARLKPLSMPADVACIIWWRMCSWYSFGYLSLCCCQNSMQFDQIQRLPTACGVVYIVQTKVQCSASVNTRPRSSGLGVLKKWRGNWLITITISWLTIRISIRISKWKF